MSLRHRKCAWLLLVLGAASTHAADSLSVTTGGTNYSDSSASYGGSVGLLHTASRWGVAAAASDTVYAIGKLGVVDFDAYSLTTAKLTLSGGVSLGSATTPATTDTLVKARIALEARPTASWALRCSDQYIELAQIHGHLVTGGAEFLPEPKIGIKVSGGYSVSGTLADRYGNFEFDWYGKSHLFAGVVAGRTGYDPSTLGQITEIRHLVQVYTGASIPLHRVTLTVALDNINLAGAPRQSLRLGLVIPFS